MVLLAPGLAGKPIGTSPISAGSTIIDRATERLGVSHHSKSPCNVWIIQLFEKKLPLFCRQLPVYIFNNECGCHAPGRRRQQTLPWTKTSANSLGERLMCWQPGFQTAAGQISWGLGLEETVMCSLLPEIRATCILGIWWAKIPFL